MHELQVQLDYERERRERLESQLDEYRREITYLNDEIDRAHADAQVRRVTPSLHAPASKNCACSWEILSKLRTRLRNCYQFKLLLSLTCFSGHLEREGCARLYIATVLGSC